MVSYQKILVRPSKTTCIANKRKYPSDQLQSNNIYNTYRQIEIDIDIYYIYIWNQTQHVKGIHKIQN